MDGGVFGKLYPLTSLNPAAQHSAGGLAAVRAYWEALRDGGQIPYRADVDPRGLSGALDRVFLAERIGNGLAQIRLSGTRVNELAGIDVRGLPLSCLFQPDARAELGHLLEAVFTGPKAADVQMSARKELGRPLLAARALFLPLLDGAGDCTILLGCIGLNGDIGRAPRRFDILHAAEERLICGLDAVPLPRMQHMAKPDPGRGHLRLVHSSD